MIYIYCNRAHDDLIYACTQFMIFQIIFRRGGALFWNLCNINLSGMDYIYICIAAACHLRRRFSRRIRAPCRYTVRTVRTLPRKTAQLFLIREHSFSAPSVRRRNRRHCSSALFRARNPPLPRLQSYPGNGPPSRETVEKERRVKIAR